MKEQVRQRALDLGFDACRFTSAEPPEHAAELHRWLQQRRHGAMEYIERNAAKRAAPDLVLPGAQSIITLAVSYGRFDDTCLDPLNTRLARKRPTALPLRRGEGWGEGEQRVQMASRAQFGERFSVGVIARYARFLDYHKIIGAKLKELTAFVNECAGADARSLWYVDTGPLLERELAQRAGLGFIGKHTNLISRTLGNWIFLAEIITSVPFEPDAPEKNRCGSCTRCLEACPTAAIIAPFQLDARRCISYLTIELKGAIPTEFRRAIGNRIYGCDDCLAVCPWNRFAREGSMMKNFARSDLAQPDLLGLLSLDEAGFRQRFADTPILRTKRRGLLRNVCVALGNVGDESALPALNCAAADPEPLIAEHASWAIAEIHKRLAVRTVRSA